MEDKNQYLERKSLPVDVLMASEKNPNKMSPREFDLLVDNMQKVGFVDPVFCRPNPDAPGMYKIIGGHHRWEAAKYLGLKEVPCTITTDPNFDEEMEDFQLVRMNVIKGNIAPSAFVDLYQKYEKKYGQEALQDLFGFAEKAEFQKMLRSLQKELPQELKAKFAKSVKEIKTIDGLAKLLNRLFTDHGSTLPYGYMVFDFGGKDSIWVRMSPKMKSTFQAVADRCTAENKCVDSVLGSFVQSIAQDEQKLAALIAAAPAPAPDDPNWPAIVAE